MPLPLPLAGNDASERETLSLKSNLQVEGAMTMSEPEKPGGMAPETRSCPCRSLLTHSRSSV